MYLCIYMNCMLLDKNRNQTWEWESILYYYMAGSPLLVKNCLIPTNGLSKVRPLKRFPIEFSQLNHSCQLTTFTIWSNHYHQVSMSSCGGHILPSSPGPSPMTPTLENYDTNVHTQLLILICRPAISCSIIILYVLIVGLILKSALKHSNAP